MIIQEQTGQRNTYHSTSWLYLMEPNRLLAKLDDADREMYFAEIYATALTDFYAYTQSQKIDRAFPMDLYETFRRQAATQVMRNGHWQTDEAMTMDLYRKALSAFQNRSVLNLLVTIPIQQQKQSVEAILTLLLKDLRHPQQGSNSES